MFIGVSCYPLLQLEYYKLTGLYTKIEGTELEMKGFTGLEKLTAPGTQTENKMLNSFKYKGSIR